MTDSSRIDDLRRRVQQDPASIAFAQLAEEYRRAGHLQEAVEVCRAGLAIHPGYLSARVTLGRAFLELNHLEEAQAELEQVLRSATENLAAIRGLAEIHQRRGELSEALTHYRAALNLARNDPDLEQTVSDLARQLEPKKSPESADGLSIDQMHQALLTHQPPASAAVVPSAAAARPAPHPAPVEPPMAVAPVEVVRPVEPPAPVAPGPPVAVAPGPLTPPPSMLPPSPMPVAIPGPVVEDVVQMRALRTIAALEQWLDRIHVAGAERHA